MKKKLYIFGSGGHAKVILSEWWVNSNHAYTMVAYDNKLERIAGIVVAVKSCWRLPNGELSDTVSICGWYVAPEYAGQGIGRVLVKHFNDFKCMFKNHLFDTCFYIYQG